MLLAEEYLELVKGQELMPPIAGSSILFQESGWNTSRYVGKYFADKTPFPIFISMRNRDGYLHIPITKINNVNREAFGRYWEKDGKLLDKFEKNFHKLNSELDLIYAKLTPGFVAETSTIEIRRQLLRVRDLVWEINGMLQFSIHLDEAMIRSYINEFNIPLRMKFEKLWDKACQPISYSFELRHSLEIISLLDQGMEWDEIALRCQYFYSSYVEINSVKAANRKLRSEYGELLSETKRHKLYVEVVRTKSKEVKKLAKYHLALPVAEKKLFDFIQENIRFRDERKDCILKYLTLISRVAEKYIAEGVIDRNAVRFCTLDELLKGKKFLSVHNDAIRKRMHGYDVLVGYSGKRKFQALKYRENFELIENQFNKQIVSHNQGEMVYGNTGAPGFISGRVRIILEVKSGQSKFKPGEILVTGMTRPEFVPLMRVAAAIITNEGGVTCHAAIVAREMDKPCIIGTKNATRVLKDGDVVEVDADKGIVNIIKRHDQSEK